MHTSLEGKRPLFLRTIEFYVKSKGFYANKENIHIQIVLIIFPTIDH